MTQCQSTSETLPLCEEGMELAEFSNKILDQSSFFSMLNKGNLTLEHLQSVFGQFYLSRNTLHNWFGLCIEKSPAFNNDYDISSLLLSLVSHIVVEIKQDHYGMCCKFLKKLGVRSPEGIKPLDITNEYAYSFIEKFKPDNKSFSASLAALAGREIIVPYRNKIIQKAFIKYYNIKKLKFWEVHEALEIEHFNNLWASALSVSQAKEKKDLIKYAKEEIAAHINFWDDVSKIYVSNKDTGK